MGIKINGGKQFNADQVAKDFVKARSGFWRCYRCKPRTEFEASEPKCPRCGARAPSVLPLVLVHFIYEHPEGPLVGQDGTMYRHACKADTEILTGGASVTCLPFAVTCPKCKESAAHRMVCERMGIDPANSGGLRIESSGCCG